MESTLNSTIIQSEAPYTDALEAIRKMHSYSIKAPLYTAKQMYEPIVADEYSKLTFSVNAMRKLTRGAILHKNTVLLSAIVRNQSGYMIDCVTEYLFAEKAKMRTAISMDQAFISEVCHKNNLPLLIVCSANPLALDCIDKTVASEQLHLVMKYMAGLYTQTTKEYFDSLIIRSRIPTNFMEYCLKFKQKPLASFLTSHCGKIPNTLFIEGVPCFVNSVSKSGVSIAMAVDGKISKMKMDYQVYRNLYS